jgi:hypothetical protein
MQQLSERDHRHTNDYSAYPLRCDSVLNSPDSKGPCAGFINIVANNPDAALTATVQAGQDL